jgi:hypothetical protein
MMMTKRIYNWLRANPDLAQIIGGVAFMIIGALVMWAVEINLTLIGPR